MFDRRPHPLEWAEYATLGLTVITLLVSATWFFPLLFLTITVGFNLLNRLRWQTQQKKRLAVMARQLQSRQEGPQETATPVIGGGNEATIQANLLALEQSFNNLVEYLNHHALRERVEHLEKSYGHLRRELFRLTETPGEEIASLLEESEPRLILPTLQLNPFSMPSDLPQWDCVQQIEAHREAIAGIALTADERYLISVGWDRFLKVWELATGNLVTSVEAHDGGILALAVTREGECSIATGGFDRAVKVWTLAEETLQLQRIFLGHQGSIHALGFTNRSDILISGGYDGALKQWSLGEDREIASSHDSLGAIYALSVATGEEYLASGGADGTITIWGVQSGEKLAFLAGNVSSVKALGIADNGSTIAAGCVDGTVKLWNYTGTGNVARPVQEISAHSGQVTTLLFGAGGQWLFTGGTDGQVAVWQANYPSAIAILSISIDRSRPVSSLTRSEGDRFLIAGCGDGMISVWEKRE
jgi:COMPASS component SWD3